MHAATGEAEAQQALKLANKLMAKYNIDPNNKILGAGRARKVFFYKTRNVMKYYLNLFF